jgi:hypothetical protein
MSGPVVTPIDGSLIAAVFFCTIDYWLSHRRGDMTPLWQRAVNAVWRISLGDFVQIVLLLVAVAFLFPRDLEPSLKWPYDDGRRSNLRQINRALHYYQKDFGTFPPLYARDATGKRMHSWRTSLLPYFEAGTLYKIYRQDEAWDGPNNSKLKDAGVYFYLSSAGANNDGGYFRPPGLTHFLAATGPGSAWGTNPQYDPSGATLMIVECPESTIYWSEPRDLANPSTFTPRRRPWYSMRSDRSYGRWALYSDGSLEFFPDGVPTLRAPTYQNLRPSFRLTNWRWFLLAAELIALGCAAWQSRDMLRHAQTRRRTVIASAIVIPIATLLTPIVPVLSPLALGVGLIACRRINAFGSVVFAFYVWYLLLHLPPIHMFFAHTDGSVTEEAREVFLVLIPVAAIPLVASLGTNKPRVGFYTLILALACLQPFGPW